MSTNSNNKTTIKTNNSIRLKLYSNYWSVIEGGSALHASEAISQQQIADANIIRNSDELKRIVKSIYVGSN